MDQPNVTTRQQKKNGKGKEKEQQEHSTAESTSSSGEKPAAQSAFLAGFSAEQAESLTTFVSDAISNAIQPMQGHLDKEVTKLSSEITKISSNQEHLTSNMANLQAMMEKMISFQHSNGEKPTAQGEFLPGFSVGKAQDLSNPGNRDPTGRNPNTRRSQHVAAESLSSAGERPTAKTGFLADFSAEKVQHPSHYPSHYPNVKLESTPQPGQGYEPNFGGVPTQYDSQSRIQLTRWRPEELGTFDPKLDDIYTFAGRIREVAEIRDPRLVQLNLSLQLRGKAKRWFELELSHADKSMLYDPANGVSAWIDALVNRFKPSGTELLQKLHNTSYGRADAAAKKDPIEYVHDVIALTRTRPLEESLMEAYLRFEPGLQVNLVPPDDQTTVHDFMDQVNAKKGAWFTVYSTFRKKEDLANQTQGSRSQRYQSARPSASGNAAGNATTSPYPTVTNGVADRRYPMHPKAYHAETAPDDDDDEDWDQALQY